MTMDFGAASAPLTFSVQFKWQHPGGSQPKRQKLKVVGQRSSLCV